MQFPCHTIMVPLQAQKSIDFSFQKLRLLRLSLENRLEEFPEFAKPREQNGDSYPPMMRRPEPITGTFYLKLLGVEGLLDFASLRSLPESDPPCTPPRSNSASHVVRNTARNFMTLPTPSHRQRELEREREVAEDDGALGGSGSGGSHNTWYRRGSKHGRSKQSASNLQKQRSLDHIADDFSEYRLSAYPLGCLRRRMVLLQYIVASESFTSVYG